MNERSHMINHLRIISLSSLSQFGKNARKRRLQLEMKQDELAHRAGVTQQHISAIERGNREPYLDLAFKIAQVLDTSVDALLGNTGGSDYRREALALREQLAEYDVKLKKVNRILKP